LKYYWPIHRQIFIF